LENRPIDVYTTPAHATSIPVISEIMGGSEVVATY